jgi:hypothetical protein
MSDVYFTVPNRFREFCYFDDYVHGCVCSTVVFSNECFSYRSKSDFLNSMDSTLDSDQEDLALYTIFNNFLQ